ncbi:MAG: hypothetical protein IPO01_17400 [Chitinophagaceae bacterium]|nr:hypothetical protein [Chitinophagaceae bacterium]MBK8786827.1 hypothetical protein [Chitinophagaceae bacterium]MBK9486884.1 hypothetical protein [Chitinophagaceae bacterium]MBL0202555.1 hypothetical protein [Chitinophagaceae bacterium]
MRYSLLFAIAILFFTACKKDKYTTAPQIVFKSFNPAEGSTYNRVDDQPVMVLEITDAEGDLGNISATEISKVYIKNTLTNKEDSIDFPDLRSVSKSNFKANIEIGLFSVMGGRSLPFNQRPYQDTLHFEVYVKDFAKNKSNVILTDKPFIYYTLP